MKPVTEFFQKLFETESWPPRWYCGTWTSFHGWLYIFSDIAIWASYFAIPLLIIWLLMKKKDIPLPSVFWLFGSFILLCGLTHLIDAIIFWYPIYRVSALIRFITAIVSFFTVLALIRVLPKAITLRTSEEYNRELEIRKQTEIKLREKTLELERKNSELESFAYIASHDLQEPLRTISNFIDIFKEEHKDKISDTAQVQLEYMQKATYRMRSLINDLLHYSKTDVEKEIISINTEELVKDISEDLRASREESQAKFVIHDLPVLHALPPIKSLFQNLISNAIKYRREDVPLVVEIYAERIENAYQFAIKDNGIGIAKENFEKIFYIFQKLHTKTKYPGNGIGLANCKKIVTLHGGQIWVESELNSGTVFYFTIPDQLPNEQETT